MPPPRKPGSSATKRTTARPSAFQVQPQRTRDLAIGEQQQRAVRRVAVVRVRRIVLARPGAVRRVVHVEDVLSCGSRAGDPIRLRSAARGARVLRGRKGHHCAVTWAPGGALVGAAADRAARQHRSRRPGWRPSDRARGPAPLAPARGRCRPSPRGPTRAPLSEGSEPRGRPDVGAASTLNSATPCTRPTRPLQGGYSVSVVPRPWTRRTRSPPRPRRRASASPSPRPAPPRTAPLRTRARCPVRSRRRWR